MPVIHSQEGVDFAGGRRRRRQQTVVGDSRHSSPPEPEINGILGSAPAAVVNTDRLCRIIRVNVRAKRQFVCSLNELHGSEVKTWIPERDGGHAG